MQGGHRGWSEHLAVGGEVSVLFLTSHDQIIADYLSVTLSSYDGFFLLEDLVVLAEGGQEDE